MSTNPVTDCRLVIPDGVPRPSGTNLCLPSQVFNRNREYNSACPGSLIIDRQYGGADPDDTCLSRPCPIGYWCGMSNHLHDALTDRALNNLDTVLFSGPGLDSVTNREFLSTINSISSRLHEAGIGPDDRVAVIANKSIPMLATYLAIIRTGAVIVPLNPAYTGHELRYLLENSRPGILVADARSIAGNMPTIRHIDGLGTLELDGNCINGDDRSTGTDPVVRGPDDLAAILYSSGTTGTPKGVMLTHGALLANARALAGIWQFSSTDVLLHTLPVFHLHGLFVATNVALVSGCRMLFFEKFTPGAVIGSLADATAMMGVPTYYRRLLDCPEIDRVDFGNFRLFISGSAPLQPEIADAWQDRTGHVLVNRYGMTEANIITSNRPGNEQDPCSVGLPLPQTEIRIRDTETGQPVADGEAGMLEIRGPGLFRGYWEMPEANRKAFMTDGFFVTGDLARQDRAGHLHIEGRSQDLIITGGLNVYPAEVEIAINSYPLVEDSAVIGVPHPEYGDGVMAVVTARKPAELDVESLAQYLTGRLAGYKRPKLIRVRDSLPRNSMEKIDRNALRMEYASTFAD